MIVLKLHVCKDERSVILTYTSLPIVWCVYAAPLLLLRSSLLPKCNGECMLGLCDRPRSLFARNMGLVAIHVGIGAWLGLEDYAPPEIQTSFYIFVYKCDYFET